MHSRVLRGRIEYTKMPPFRLPPAEHPYDLEYDSNTALWLVTAACLVYAPADYAENIVKNLWEIPYFCFFDITDTDTQAMAFATSDFIVVAFRGTESKSDWKTNLDHTHDKFSALPQFEGITVHRGFNTACLSVLPAIETWVLTVGGKAANPDKPLYIGGHSLGGALSTLAYAHWTLRESPISVNGVVTIGQPRVGNPKFCETMNQLGPCVLQRIFNTNDVVPTVPPGFKGYQHYGDPIYFNAKGELIRKPPGRVTRHDKTKAWVSGKSGVAAHSGFFYLELVRKYDALLAKRAATAAVYKAVFTIHSATGLKPADSDGLSDPFVQLKYRDLTLTGPVQPKTLNPVWNHDFVIPELSLHDHISLEVWDSDKTGYSRKDDFLGTVKLHIDDATNESEVEIPLLPRPGRSDVGITGSLVISANYFLLRGSLEQVQARAKITLHGARDIKAADRGGTSDPYARIYCGSVHKRTDIIYKTLNPDWEYTFDIASLAPGDLMYIDLWDKDKSSRDDFLGQAIVAFDDNFASEERVEIPLQPRAGKKKDQSKNITGNVIMSFDFTPQPNEGLKVAKGRVTIHSARSLKAADSNGYSDPFVVVHVGTDKSVFKTPVIKKNLNPTWELSFTLDKVVAGTEMTFEVWDHDTIGSNDFLGQVVLKFSPLLDSSQEWYSLSGRAKQKDRGITGDINLSFAWTPILVSQGSLASSIGRA